MDVNGKTLAIYQYVQQALWDKLGVGTEIVHKSTDGNNGTYLVAKVLGEDNVEFELFSYRISSIISYSRFFYEPISNTELMLIDIVKTIDNFDIDNHLDLRTVKDRTVARISNHLLYRQNRVFQGSAFASDIIIEEDYVYTYGAEYSPPSHQHVISFIDMWRDDLGVKYVEVDGGKVYFESSLSDNWQETKDAILNNPIQHDVTVKFFDVENARRLDEEYNRPKTTEELAAQQTWEVRQAANGIIESLAQLASSIKRERSESFSKELSTTLELYLKTKVSAEDFNTIQHIISTIKNTSETFESIPLYYEEK